MNKNYNNPDEISSISAKNNPYVLTDEEFMIDDGPFFISKAESIEKPETEYAGLGQRMGAYLVDLFILISINIVLYLLVWIFNPSIHYTFYNKLLFVLIIWTLYYGLFESSIFQATPGKMLFKIKVISNRGNKLNFIRSSLRFLVSFFSILPVGFGIWDLEGTPHFQAWHDRLLGCYVIKSAPVAVKKQLY